VYILITMRPRRQLDRARAAEVAATCACFNIRKATRAVTQYYDDVLRPSDLRTTQFTLLVLLQGHGSMSINALADAAGTDRTTLTRNLAILEERRLVRIRPGEDARVRIVELTVAGDEAAAAALPLWERAQHQVATTLGPQRLARLLSDLSAAVGAVGEGGANPAS
jgi:DNA-binding MarR family transcriptional regulator